MTDRNLTDGDVKAIVDLLKDEIARDLFAEAGKGLWQWVRKTLIWALLLFAAYHLTGGKPLPAIMQAVK